jgi:hypothetical protein
MIFAEFKITNKKYGESTKKIPYTESMNGLKSGDLIDVEFSEEGIMWECTVEKWQHISNGNEHIMMFDLRGVRIGAPGKQDTLNAITDFENL